MAVRKRILCVATCCTEQSEKVMRVTLLARQSICPMHGDFDRWGCMQRHSLCRRLLRRADRSGMEVPWVERGFSGFNVVAVMAGWRVELS